MTHEEILDSLGWCICEADERNFYGIGDRLFEIITVLREKWGMDDE